MASKAVSDTGPILHLKEIDFSHILKIFSQISIPEEVARELNRNKIKPFPPIKLLKLNPNAKDTIEILANQYDLDLGESEAIALALQEKMDYFLTDDLEARNVAKEFNLEAHGTIGLILRAFREKLADKNTTIKKLKELKSKSSLFITQSLIAQAISAVENFKHIK